MKKENQEEHKKSFDIIFPKTPHNAGSAQNFKIIFNLSGHLLFLKNLQDPISSKTAINPKHHGR